MPLNYHLHVVTDTGQLGIHSCRTLWRRSQSNPLVKGLQLPQQMAGMAATAMQRCHLHFHLHYGRCDTTLQATICLSIWAFASLYGPGSDVGVGVGVGVMSEGKLLIFMRTAGATPTARAQWRGHQMRHLRADADLPRGVGDAINKRRAPGLQLP